MSDIATVPNGALMGFIERAAKDPEFDVAKFETLLRMRRDEAHEQARRIFNSAMAACQSEMQPVLRVSVNPGVKSKYAKLEAIDQQMRPIYTRHGFSVRFGSAPPPQPGWMRVTCTVAHESGYFEENYLDSPVSTQGSQGGRVAMTAVQAVGSVVTYLRRYLLGMVFNIVQADMVGEDHDGEPPPPTRHDQADDPGGWKEFVHKVHASYGAALTEREVLAIGDRKEIAQALQDQTAPRWVKRDLETMSAAAYARVRGEELPDLVIPGEKNLAAG